MMPLYTLTLTGADGRQHTIHDEFPDDETAICNAAHRVTPQQPTLAVTRGAGEEAEYLGGWDWSGGSVQRWTPDD